MGSRERANGQGAGFTSVNTDMSTNAAAVILTVADAPGLDYLVDRFRHSDPEYRPEPLAISL